MPKTHPPFSALDANAVVLAQVCKNATCIWGLGIAVLRAASHILLFWSCFGKLAAVQKCSPQCPNLNSNLKQAAFDGSSQEFAAADNVPGDLGVADGQQVMH